MALRGAPGLWRTLSGRRRRAATRTIRAGRGAGIDLGPILQFVLAVDDHDITRIQAGAQAHAVAGGLRDEHGINFRNDILGSRVFSDGIKVSTLRATLDGSGGNDGEIMFGVNKKVDVDELIGEKGVVDIAKDGLELVGPGGQINLIVDGLEFSGGNFGSVVAVVGIDHKLSAGAELGVHLGKLILWQTENHRYRLELGDDQESASVGGMHDVANIHEAKTDAAADRRSDAGIGELEFSVVNEALI